MAYKTITIRESTYRKLADWKEKDESFSEMLDREFDQKISTLKDLAEWAKVNAGRKLGLRQRKDSPFLSATSPKK